MPHTNGGGAKRTLVFGLKKNKTGQTQVRGSITDNEILKSKIVLVGAKVSAIQRKPKGFRATKRLRWLYATPVRAPK
ncbi:MAG: hypothetical protein IPL65_20675 [Lewinellaceae bacterium]|nr:hypothetical protein [Lewinellaceae bacterium]